MRIVGGQYKGRTITAPRGTGTRPTTDRTRESLFNILCNKINFEDMRVIDLFAGSGALGLEALSRGAGYCLFVEQAAPARGAIRDNIEALQLFGQTKLHKRSATALGDRPTQIKEPFDLAFLDAPYDKGLTEPALESLLQGGWLAPQALCIVEQGTRETAPSVVGFTLVDERKFGDTMIRFLEHTL